MVQACYKRNKRDSHAKVVVDRRLYGCALLLVNSAPVACVDSEASDELGVPQGQRALRLAGANEAVALRVPLRASVRAAASMNIVMSDEALRISPL